MERGIDEVAGFGRDLDRGENPDIERGGSLGRGHGKPGDNPDHPGNEHGRKPPKGRSHATLF
jgi:hypothetical protein